MKYGSEDISDKGLFVCFPVYKPIIDEQLSYFLFQEKGIFIIIKIILVLILY